MSENAAPQFIQDTRPVAQLEGVRARCEAHCNNGWRWCRRDATTVVTVRGGDEGETNWRFCTYHAHRMVDIGSWRTDIGEDYVVASHRALYAKEASRDAE